MDPLLPEALHAGDIIEYYSPVFIPGDPRGLREATILKIIAGEEQYPLRIDSGEL
jgi:hypothetical protein